jgi:succinate dehydrogenase flavin-adding protein (antitoxin of CptAB toxin-antitoxin module)
MIFNQQDYAKLGVENMDDEDTKVMLMQLQGIVFNKLATQAVMSMDDAAVEELNALENAPDEQLQAWLSSKIPNFDQVLQQTKDQTIDGIVERREEMLSAITK